MLIQGKASPPWAVWEVHWCSQAPKGEGCGTCLKSTVPRRPPRHWSSAVLVAAAQLVVSHSAGPLIPMSCPLVYWIVGHLNLMVQLEMIENSYF